MMRWVFRRSAVERELDAELQSYVEEISARTSVPGAPADAASRTALPTAGGLLRGKEACRESWRTHVIDDWTRDVIHGVRALRRTPAFTLTALLTLAIGIGASVAIFGQVNAVFLAQLPVDRPDELWLVHWTSQPAGVARRYNPTNRLSYSAYRTLDDHATAFSGLACWSGAFTNFGVHDRVETQIVSGSFFPLLGVRAIAGRTLAPEDDRPGVCVAVISHALWQRTFGGAASAVGTTLPVNGEPVEIVGVTPRHFIGLNPSRAVDLYLPLSMYATARFDGSVPRSLRNDRDWTA